MTYWITEVRAQNQSQIYIKMFHFDVRLALFEFCRLVGPSSSAMVLENSWGFIHYFTNIISDLMTIRLIVNMFKSDNTIPCATPLTLKNGKQQNKVVLSSLKRYYFLNDSTNKWDIHFQIELDNRYVLWLLSLDVWPWLTVCH